MLRPFAGLALLLGLAAAVMSRPPDVAPPKGETFKFSFAASKVFPGTTRDVTVYVPRQFDGTSPACVYVNQDGVQYDAPAVFDRLIHAKKMPVTVGVFVTPGVVKAPNPAALDRFNRSFEYDGLGDAYARFLLDELLPAVETKATADGRKITLSKSGNDRAIGGASSGAIAAFTAAWERPDGFSRVFSAIGTYVGLRGGHNYSTLVRKVEPKALRVYLEDGSNDLDIYGGDWWVANQAMERSLTFAGYEVNHSWGDGKHDTKHATRVFPEATEFLWKGWPKPVTPGKGSPQLQEILVPGETWQLVGEGYQFTEGPAADAKGDVYFCDVPRKQIFKLDAAGKPAEWTADSGNASGLAFAPDGTLFASGGAVKRFGPGTKRTDVAPLSTNDLVVTHAGRIYATHNANNRGTVKLVSPDGAARDVDTGIGYANGVTVSPDQSLLYVADSRSHWVYSYQIQPDGTLKHKQKYYHLHTPDTADDSGADGLKCDTAGRLWVATRMGVQVCDQAGRVLAVLPTPNNKCSNLAFGGPDRDTLYVTANEKVYRRKVKAKGVDPAATPVKPTPL